MHTVKFLRGTVEKIIDKSPIQSRFVRNLQFLDPSFLVKEPSKALINFQRARDMMVDLKRIQADNCDLFKAEFVELQVLVYEKKGVSTDFDFSAEGLDVFSGRAVGANPCFKMLQYQ